MDRSFIWRKGDWGGYFGLLANNLTNLLTMIGLLLFVVGFPKEMVYGRIAPAFGLQSPAEIKNSLATFGFNPPTLHISRFL